MALLKLLGNDFSFSLISLPYPAENIETNTNNQ